MAFCSNFNYSSGATERYRCRRKALNVVRKLTQHQTNMKFLSTVFILTLSINLFAQDKVVGRYRDYFGSRLQVNADNTFRYTWNFDLSGSWTKGTWTQKGDTFYFHMTPVYDTLKQFKHNGVTSDTLLLSDDEVSERISPERAAANVLSSGGQNRIAYPDKLVFRKGRLYKIVNGKLLTKPQKGIFSDRKWNPWFFKSND
ncbi:hypothetical protein QUB53_28960 [Microcoleus sp. AT8-B4]|uniref:hypothetical protein n=1 Tax=Microcoleus sp. AT8-B4 TaxID=2818620 RepID=UPI002FD4C546